MLAEVLTLFVLSMFVLRVIITDNLDLIAFERMFVYSLYKLPVCSTTSAYLSCGFTSIGEEIPKPRYLIPNSSHLKSFYFLNKGMQGKPENVLISVDRFSSFQLHLFVKDYKS